MADAKTEQEPSIEEILESIRQIISDDGEAPSATKAEAAATPAATDAADPEVDLRPKSETKDKSDLDLSQKEDEAPDTSDIDLSQQAADEEEDEIIDLTQKVIPSSAPVIDLQDNPVKETPQEKPAAAPPPQKAAQPAASQPTAESLLSADATDLSAHALARLLSGNVAIERELPGRVGNVTLEDMTRELLRPLLKTWLDENLPAIIEKQVAREIEKIARLAMKQ